ncbi:MAG: prepilin-type N-terminal cleavage/methylation domain-containing protein [Alphaproteobacteria bacterium]
MRLPRRPHRSERGRTDRAGFTLLEVLIALAILALGLGALYAALAQSSRYLRTAVLQTQLEQTAQSVLDGFAFEGGAGAERGRMGSLTWTRSVRPVAGIRPASGLQPVLIEVTVRDEDGRSFTLETIRLHPIAGRIP